VVKTFQGTFNIISLDGQWILITKKQAFITFIAIKVSGKLQKTEARNITRNNINRQVMYISYNKTSATAAVSTHYAVAHTNVTYFRGQYVSAL
jgi:histidinol dehydrogenase